MLYRCLHASATLTMAIRGRWLPSYKSARVASQPAASFNLSRVAMQCPPMGDDLEAPEVGPPAQRPLANAGCPRRPVEVGHRERLSMDVRIVPALLSALGALLDSRRYRGARSDRRKASADLGPLAILRRSRALVSLRRVRTRIRVVGMRLQVRSLGVEVEILDDGVVGLGVLLRPAFIAGAHGPR